jgi:hypothetical protein
MYTCVTKLQSEREKIKHMIEGNQRRKLTKVKAISAIAEFKIYLDPLQRLCCIPLLEVQVSRLYFQRYQKGKSLFGSLNEPVIS